MHENNSPFPRHRFLTALVCLYLALATRTTEAISVPYTNLDSAINCQLTQITSRPSPGGATCYIAMTAAHCLRGSDNVRMRIGDETFSARGASHPNFRQVAVGPPSREILQWDVASLEFCGTGLRLDSTPLCSEHQRFEVGELMTSDVYYGPRANMTQQTRFLGERGSLVIEVGGIKGGSSGGSLRKRTETGTECAAGVLSAVTSNTALTSGIEALDWMRGRVHRFEAAVPWPAASAPEMRFRTH